MGLPESESKRFKVISHNLQTGNLILLDTETNSRLNFKIRPGAKFDIEQSFITHSENRHHPSTLHEISK